MNEFGNLIINAESYEDALSKAGLNWEVTAEDTYFDYPDGIKRLIPTVKTIVRDTDKAPLGVVSDRYVIVNNKDAFELTEILFKDSDIEFIRGGEIKNGASTWIECKVKNKEFSEDGNTEPIIVFKNSHDGLGSVLAMFSFKIGDTYMSLPVGTRRWHTAHKGSIVDKMKEAQELLLENTQYMKNVVREINVLKTINLTFEDITSLIERLFPIPADGTEAREKLSDRQVEKILSNRMTLSTIYDNIDTDSKFDDNAYRFILAVATYVNECCGRKTPDGDLNRWMSINKGNALIDKAYNMVITL